MHEAIGNTARTPIPWTRHDAVVFAAAVGADPDRDLDYLDLSRGPSVLPTFLGARVFREGQNLNLWEPWAFDPRATFTLGCDMGLPGPISAGQLLIGVAARTLTARFADGDHGALSRLAVEFASPHIVGQPLTMQAQADGTNAFDFAVYSGGEPVLLGGRAELS